MFTSADLLELNSRGHRSFARLLVHCSEFTPEQMRRSLDGFGEPTIHRQIFHVVGATEYWLGVIQGSFRVDEDEEGLAYPDLAALEGFRKRIEGAVADYLRGASDAELNTPREMTTWDGKSKLLVPALIFFRTLTHIYHHQGQIAAMCRILGRPIPPGMDFPLV